MALNPHIKDTLANSALDTLLANLNGGFLDIYDSTGTGQPAHVTTAITTQVKLASLGFNATAFGASSSGLATANAITQDSDADATGTATWARWYKSDHTTAIIDCTVGSSGCDINLTSASIIQHTIVSISSLTVALPV